MNAPQLDDERVQMTESHTSMITGCEIRFEGNMNTCGPVQVVCAHTVKGVIPNSGDIECHTYLKRYEGNVKMRGPVQVACALNVKHSHEMKNNYLAISR